MIYAIVHNQTVGELLDTSSVVKETRFVPIIETTPLMTKNSHRILWIVLITLATVGGVLWYADRSDWSLADMGQSLLGGYSQDARVFIPPPEQKGDKPLDLAEARKLYLTSRKALADKDYDLALEGFKTLEPVYPGLREIILMHQATAYAKLNNEGATQKRLREVIKRYGDSPLAPRAAYLLAQSHFRAREYDRAQQYFEWVQGKYPDSSYATGGLYYLGQLALRDGDGHQPDRKRATGMFRNYLEQCPDCTFSSAIAEQLEELLANPDARDHQLIGLAYAYGDRPAKAYPHLKAAPFEKVWQELAQAQNETRRFGEAYQTVVEGVKLAKEKEAIRFAVDTAVQNSPHRASTTLKRLDAMKLPTGPGDYILWKLASYDEANASHYYRQILERYPEGDFAPESSWSLMWPDLVRNDCKTFVNKAETHMGRYFYAYSAPRTLYWIGKCQEKQEPDNPQQAAATYRKLLNDYPTDYYAYRAWGRLHAIRDGKDPGWKTAMNREYPPVMDLKQMTILPPMDAFIAKTDERAGQRMHQAARELQQIGTSSDLALVVTDTLGELPPAVESWTYHMAGVRNKGIRVIRDALVQRNNPDDRHRLDLPKNSYNPVHPNKSELQLLYPVYFGTIIEQEAYRNRLDPFIIQALMRQESYFDERAVSVSDARGLMQLLPSTAREVAGWEGMRGFRTSQLFDPATNVRLGSRYLAYLHKTFDGNSMPAVGAYNGGPGAMGRWVRNSAHFHSDPDMFVETIPYEQTRNYIKHVFGGWWSYNLAYGDSEQNLALIR